MGVRNARPYVIKKRKNEYRHKFQSKPVQSDRTSSNQTPELQISRTFPQNVLEVCQSTVRDRALTEFQVPSPSGVAAIGKAPSPPCEVGTQIPESASQFWFHRDSGRPKFARTPPCQVLCRVDSSSPQLGIRNDLDSE